MVGVVVRQQDAGEAGARFPPGVEQREEAALLVGLGGAGVNQIGRVVADEKCIRVIGRRQAVAEEGDHLHLRAEENHLRRPGGQRLEQRPGAAGQLLHRPAADRPQQQRRRRRDQDAPLFPRPQGRVGAEPFPRVQLAGLHPRRLSGRNDGREKGGVEADRRERRRDQIADVREVAWANRQAESVQHGRKRPPSASSSVRGPRARRRRGRSRPAAGRAGRRFPRTARGRRRRAGRLRHGDRRRAEPGRRGRRGNCP